MNRIMHELPRRTIQVNAGQGGGPLELWRHSIGLGGVNTEPLPIRVIEGARKLKPQIIRIFIQEHFNIYPEHGRFDWHKLDPYMSALAATGANVMAAITIKPAPLYPSVDQKIWQPADWAEWQQVIRELVKRYSVDRPIVTHWEIGNETDIGEWGGCPYLITDPREYGEYYRKTTQPVLEVFPQAKVGGPALAGYSDGFLQGFTDYCLETSTPVDFWTWHLYHDDPQQHANLIRQAEELRKRYPQHPVEMYVTEWAKGFEPVSVEDSAFQSDRAAHTAASILAMCKTGIDGTFYYHLWDQVVYWEDFSTFFRDPNIMYEHWNEIPHRFGLFGVNGEVRPQYFVYQILGRMGETELPVIVDEPGLMTLAGKGTHYVSVLIANFDVQTAHDCVVTVRWSGLTPGLKDLTVYRIDEDRHWCTEKLELVPVEQRETDVLEAFYHQVYCPADSVTLVTLSER